MFTWFCDLTGRGLTFSGDLIRAKALKIAKDHGITPDNFKVFIVYIRIGLIRALSELNRSL